MGSPMFLFQEVTRQAGIDDLPCEVFAVFAITARVEGGVNPCFAKSRVEVASEAGCGVDNASDAAVARREESLLVSNAR